MMDNNLSEEAKKVLQAKKKIIERLVEAEVEEILPQRYAKKREGKETPLICPNCGVRKSNQIRRDGHHRRKPRVTEGIIEEEILRLCLSGAHFQKIKTMLEEKLQRE
jgi:hypothetical protein